MRKALLMLLILLPAAAALDLQVHLSAPESILPGEAANISISATLSGVPIISFPANATVTYPDGTTQPLQLTNTYQGSYTATLYSVSEGAHIIDVSVAIDDTVAAASATVQIEKPSVGITIAAVAQNGSLTGTISQDSASDYTIEVAPFSTGDLSQLQYAPLCTASCGTECTFSCAAAQESGIAKFTTRKGYTYTVYVPFGSGEPQLNTSYDRISGVGEPLTVTTGRPATVYAQFGSQLSQLPLSGESYVTTPLRPGNGTVYVREGELLATYPIEIIVRTNVEEFAPETASDGVSSWWYGFVSASRETLLRLPADPGLREAYLLREGARTQLRWEKTYLVVPAGSGWVEVRRAQPATAPAYQNLTGYGLLVGGAGLQRHELGGRVQAFDAALEPLQAYSNGSTSVLYTEESYAALIQNSGGTLTITQPLKSGEQGAVQYSLPGNSTETVFSIYSYEGTLIQKLLFAGNAGTRDLLFSMPPGRYLAVASGEKNAAAGLVLYSEHPSITFSAPQTLRAPQNSEVRITHAITNSDLLLSRTVDLSVEGAFTMLINATDSNSNGLADVVLAPGETRTVTGIVFIAPNSTSGTVTLIGAAGELNATVTDTIEVDSAAALTYVDADVVTIQGTPEQPVVSIQNNHHTDLPATLYITGPALSTQINTLLPPGLSNVTLPDVGASITVRLQLAGDTRPENNERTRHFRSPFSTRLVHINERLHADHNHYTVQLPRLPGYVLSWIDEQGGERYASAMHEGETTLWDLGPISANHELYAALLPGEPQQVNLTTVLDNSNPLVTKKGAWVSSISTPGYIGFDYFLDLNIDKNAAVIYPPQLSHDLYRVSVYGPADASFAANVPVTVHGSVSATLSMNQKKGGWQYLGLYELFPNSSVVIETARTTQFVAADAVSFTPISQIGGLELLGNSTLHLRSTTGRPLQIPLTAYLETVQRTSAPQEVQVTAEAGYLTLLARTSGNYTITAYDGERELTVHLQVEDPAFDAEFPAQLQSSQGTVDAVLYVDEALAPLVSELLETGSPDALRQIGESAGWVFNVETELAGKEVTLEQAYLPNFVLPLQITPLQEDRKGRTFLFDAYTLQLNGLEARSIRIRDIAEGTQLMSCQNAKNCKWQPMQELVYGHKYIVSLPAVDVTLAEASTLETVTRKQGRRDMRGKNWERIEKSGRGTLTVTPYPRFVEQADGFVPINTTITLAEGVTDLDSPGAKVVVRDNLFRTELQLQSGNDMVSLAEEGRSLRLSVPQPGVRGKAVLNKMVYEGIEPHVDLSYEIEAGLLKELYTIHSTEAPRTYTSTLTVPGARLDETPEYFVFRNSTTGELLWLVWKPFAFDELGKNDTPGHRTQLTTTVSQQGDDYTLTTVMDEEWFTDPARVFPVYIDPTVVTGSLSGSDGGYIRSGEFAFPDDDFVTGEFNTMTNGYLRFSIGAALPSRAIVTDANFSAGVQQNQGWDFGDFSVFSFVNTSTAATLWSDSFREESEYNQGAISVYNFTATTDSSAGTRYNYAVNSTGIAGLQQILVEDQQTYVTVRVGYLDSAAAGHASSNEFLSWYTGINCCAVTGTPIVPELNISYSYENDTPQFSSPGFNQSSYNTTQTVRFSVNITDASSGIESAIVTVRDPAAADANYTLTPYQQATVVSTTVSTDTSTFTARNVTRLRFFDDFSQSAILTLIWSVSSDWEINSGQAFTDNTDQSAFLTALPELDLSSQDSAIISFFYNYDSSNEAGDCLEFHMQNDSGTWNTLLSWCDGNAHSGIYTDTITDPQYLSSNFGFRFLADSNSNGDDMFIDNVNLTSYESDRDDNSSWNTYTQVTDSALRNVTSMDFTVQVTSYSPLGSVARSNMKPDLELQVFDGVNWASAGTFGLNTTYTGSGVNNTARNFTLTVSDQAVIAAWMDTKYRRDLRIRATSVDYADPSNIDQVVYNRIYFNSSQTGGDVYETAWGNGTLTTLGRYNATYIFANDTVGNSNTTAYGDLVFDLYSIAMVTGRAVPGGLVAYPEDVSFTCTVTDRVFGTPIQNYNVTITSNVTGTISTQNTNASGEVSEIVTINDISLLTCHISDRTDLYYYAHAPSDSRIVAIDTQWPQWSQWSLGVASGPDLANGVNLNRTNTSIQVRSYWTDEIGLDDAFIEHNGTGSFVNYSDPLFGDGVAEDWANYTFDFADGGEFSHVGLINISTTWASDFVPHFNYTTPSKYFYLYGAVNLTAADVSPAVPAVLQNTQFACTVTDLYGIPAVGYTVEFYQNSTSLGSAVTGSDGRATVTFNTPVTDTYTMTCNITDDPSDYYYMSTLTEQQVFLTVVPDSTPPDFLGLSTVLTTDTLGEPVNISASINDVAGIASAHANITLPDGSETSVALTGSGTSFSGLYTSAQEGMHLVRVTAADPSGNTNVSAYSHFIIAGKAAPSIRTVASRYDSNTDVDLAAMGTLTSGDLEAGTQTNAAPATTTQITNVSAYFSSTGSCAGTLRTDPAAGNSCRRAGFVDNNNGKLWGANRLRSGHNGSVISANQILGAVMFDLSSIPDDAAFTSGNLKLTIVSDNSWENGDTLNVYAHTATANAVWDSNGPELNAMQTLGTEFTVGTISGGTVNAGGTTTLSFSSTQLESLESFLPEDGITITVNPGSGDTNEWVDFQSGFHTSSTANDPELAFNYTTPTIDYNSSAVSYLNTLPVNQAEVTAIRINVTISATDLRGSSTSVFERGLGQMPALRIDIYNGSAYQRKYACDILQRGDGANTTAGTCSITVRDSNILNAWLAAANRDLQLQAINLDNRNEGIDSINWTAVTVELFNGSNYLSTAPESLAGNITLTVDRLVGGSYVHNDTVYNVSQTVVPGQAIGLSTLWNAAAWDTGDRAEGAYRAVVRLVNSSGSVVPQGDGGNTEAAYTFTINDTVLPYIVNALPLNGSTVWGMNSSGTVFGFSAIDATGFASCSVRIDGASSNTTTAVQSGVGHNLTVYAIADGAHLWNVACTDNATAQNFNESVNWTIYVDNTAPAVTFLTANDTNRSVQDINVTVNITDNNWTPLSWRAFVGTTLNQSGATTNASVFNISIHDLPEGRHNITVEGTDGVGLASNSTILITIDLTPPNPFINTSSNTQYNVSNPTVNLTIYDNLSTVINYTLYVNGVANATNTTPNGTFTQQNLTQIGEGNHTVILEAKDQAGNMRNSTAIRIIVDLNPPSVSLGSPASLYNTTNTTNNFSWTYTDLFSASAVCSLIIDGAVNTTAAASNATSTSQEVTGFAQGKHNWTVSCVDIAGNTGYAAGTRNFTVDSGLPVINLVSPANNTVNDTDRNATLTFSASDALSSLDACELYVGGSLNQTMASPANDTNLDFDLLDLDNGAYPWYVSCNDTAGNRGYSENRTFTVNITVTVQGTGGQIRLDREGGGTIDPEVVALTAYLSDSRGGGTVTFKANLTDPVIAGQTDIVLGSNTTNGSGHTVFYWNPNSTTYAGDYTWWAEEPRSAPLNSISAFVFGSLDVTYTDGTLQPNSNYNTSQTVRAAYNISGYGPETRDVLNASYGLTVAVNFTQPNSSRHPLIDAAYNGSQWNTSYTLAFDAEIGVWNISAATNSTWFYRNATGERNFTVKGFANAASPANGTAVDRDGADAVDPDLLALIVHVPGATQPYTVNFTANLTNPAIAGQSDLLLGSNTTNSSGHAVLYWNPDSTVYAGNYTWWGVSAVSYVNATAALIVKGGLDVTYRSGTAEPNSTYFINDTARIEVNLSGYGPESRDNLSTPYVVSVTNTLVNTTGGSIAGALSYTGPFWNRTHTLLSLYSPGVWNTTANASGAYWYGNSSNRTATIYSHMNVTSNSTAPASIFAFQSTTTTCTVQDQHTGYAVQGAIVSFYRDSALFGSNATDASGTASYTYQVNQSGTWTVTCNVTDQPAIYYYRGSDPERNMTLTVSPFGTTAESPANGTVIDRDGASATDPDVVLLNVSVPAWVPDGERIDFTANMSAPMAGQTDVFLGNNTTSGGYAVLWYDPGSSIYAGNWTWFGNHTASVPNATKHSIVKGDLGVVFRDGASHPNATYNDTQTVIIESNLTSVGGPETRDELNDSYSGAVNATLTQPGGASADRTLSFTNPYWNASLRILDFPSVGNWTAQLLSSADYFYSRNSSNRSFLVYGFANVTGVSLSDSTVYAYETVTAQCGVMNGNTGASLSGYPIEFLRNGAALGTNSTNSSGSASYTFQTVVAGSYSINCTIADNLSLYYYAQLATVNQTLTVEPFPITPVTPTNGTVVDRDSVAADPDFVVLNVSVPGELPDGVPIDFRMNLTDPVIGGQVNVIIASNTTLGGYAAVTLDPNSTTYAGNWTWFGNNSEAVSNGTRSLLVRGSYAMAYSDVALNPNSTYLQDDTVVTEVNLTSGALESRSELNSTYGALVNATIIHSGGSSSAVGLTFNSSLWLNDTLAPLTAVGLWNQTVQSSVPHFYSAPLLSRNFTVYGFANVTEINLTPNPIDAYNTLEAICRVQNQFTGVSVENMNVTFYQEGSLIGSNRTNSSGQASVWHQEAVQGLFNVTCNITDDLAAYYYAGSQPNQSMVLNVTPVLLTPVAPANDTVVDRDSVAADVDFVTLTGSVRNTVPDGANISFYANLTDPAIAGQSDIFLGWNLTDSTQIDLTFEPNSTLYAGTYTWWMDSSGGEPNGSRTFIVKGGANVTYATAMNPNVTQNQTDNVLFDFNVTSFGPENASVLNSTYLLVVNASLVPPTTASVTTPAALFNGSQWRTNYTLPPNAEVGVWDTNGTVGDTYFYPLTYSLRSFIVVSLVNLSVWDIEEELGATYFGGTNGTFFANYTDGSGSEIAGANCSFSILGQQSNMTEVAARLRYEAVDSVLLEGVARYNATCSKQYYNTISAWGNVSVHSVVNVSLHTRVAEVAAGVREVSFNITNLQSYTEHDIWVRHFVPRGFGAQYYDAPLDTQLVSDGLFVGNVTRWYVPNLTAGQSTQLRYNVTGEANISMLYDSALQVYTSNGTAVYG